VIGNARIGCLPHFLGFALTARAGRCRLDPLALTNQWSDAHLASAKGLLSRHARFSRNAGLRFPALH
jgi:hypothetical protein